MPFVSLQLWWGFESEVETSTFIHTYIHTYIHFFRTDTTCASGPTLAFVVFSIKYVLTR
jgi:hypothetical protein